MGTLGILIGIVAMAVFGILIWSAVVGSRSPRIALASIPFCLVSLLGSWYSWAESRSVPWTIGYLVFGLIALLAVVVSVARRPISRESADGNQANGRS